ncbi:thioredoxin family protein [Flavobacterium maritimum]|uniref:thioredoxin family protein n=1 Tax=Flavobacterium maritimum TaxID=3149042 RepID=UPI0032B42993
MKASVVKALFNSYTYSEYKKVVSDLLEVGKSTGMRQSEELTHYTLLNETRLRRLDKTIKISEENVSKLHALKKQYIWLVIAEGWCADGAQSLPVFDKMALETDGKIDLKIVLRDDNDDVMNDFLTNGARAIPKLIVIDKATGNVVGDWGPRPAGAVELIQNYKKEHGVVDETAKADLQMWYFHDKGLSTQNEIMELMQGLDS